MSQGVAVPKWLQAWIARLMPSHHSNGDGALHIGGKVTQVHVTHNHIYQAPPAPPPPRPPRPSELPAHLQPPISQAHRDLLMLLVEMRPLDRVVFEFMRREFSLRMVIDLDEVQLKRTRRYAEAVQTGQARNGAAKRRARNARQAGAPHEEFL